MSGELSASLFNLSESDARLLREGEWRHGVLSELAFSLAHMPETAEALSARDFFAACEGLLSEGDIAPSGYDDRLALARFVLGAAEARFGPLTAEALLGGPFAPPARSRTVLIGNDPSLEAYQRFAPLLSSPVPSYRESLRALCDDVENGYADYAVLPFFAGRTPVGTVFSLIEERGLSVLATAKSLREEDALTVALVGREPIAKEPTSLAVRFAGRTEDITAALSAASALGLRLLFSEVMPAAFLEGALLCRAAFTGGGKAAFIAYLSLFAKTFTVLGLYTEL